VVDDHCLGGHVVEREEDARGEQDDEGVQGDLAQHEGPVVGEDLVQEGAAALGDAEAVVELADDLAGAAVGAEGSLLLSLGAGLAVGSAGGVPVGHRRLGVAAGGLRCAHPELRSQ